MRYLPTILTASLTLLIASSGSADTLLSATLTNGQEPGNVTPTSSVTGLPRVSAGQATFVLNTAMTSMTFSATITGIDFTGTQSPDTNDNLAAAHIHASSDPNFTPPANAGVVWGFFGSPFNDNNPNDVVQTLLPSPLVGATISGKWDLTEGNSTTLAAQIPNILAGRSYINFHTAQFPGGELRGAITVIPEPATVTLLTCGLLGLACAAWRRRAALNS